MKKYQYKKVNAFTLGISRGNPAAYLMVEDGITAEEMLGIGKEHKGFVSEVVFCEKSEKADYKLTYFSSECEVDFCGHGTVAAMYDIISENKELMKKPEVIIETNKKGVLTVYNNISDDGVVYITAPKAIHLEQKLSKEKIAAALGILTENISDKFPVDFIDAGLRTLLVPIESFSKEISIYPDETNLKDFCLANGIDIILIFSKETNSDKYMAHTRVFAPKFGYLEDPATGSGNSAFANYMLKNNLWNGEPIAVEQGGNNIVFNQVNLKVKDNCVLFGGKATTVIAGEYYIY